MKLKKVKLVLSCFDVLKLEKNITLIIRDQRKAVRGTGKDVCHWTAV
jgi:hypothetical protein